VQRQGITASRKTDVGNGDRRLDGDLATECKAH
jgi:hypothetical protein